MATNGVTIVHTETWAVIFLRYSNDRAPPRAGSFFDYTPLQQVMDTFVRDAY